jgi:hypothetical protein
MAIDHELRAQGAAPTPSLEFDREAHRYFVSGVRMPSVTQALTFTRLIDYRGVPEEVLEAAARRGRRVHSAMHYYCQNDLVLDSVGPQTMPYVQAGRDWILRTGFGAQHVEQPLFNAVRRVCGTPDARGAFPDGSLGLVDWKTTGLKSPGHAIQTAAYVDMLPEPRRWRRIVVYLRPDGSHDAVEYPQANFLADRGVFYSALQCLWWTIEHTRNGWEL